MLQSEEDTSRDYAVLSRTGCLFPLFCKVTTAPAQPVQLSRVVYRSRGGRPGWLLQNTTEHLLVIASICLSPKGKPLPKLKVPIHFVEIFFFFLHYLWPLLPFTPRLNPGSIHSVCVVSKVWFRDP